MNEIRSLGQISFLFDSTYTFCYSSSVSRWPTDPTPRNASTPTLPIPSIQYNPTMHNPCLYKYHRGGKSTAEYNETDKMLILVKTPYSILLI
jgi:hypothetical protein